MKKQRLKAKKERCKYNSPNLREGTPVWVFKKDMNVPSRNADIFAKLSLVAISISMLCSLLAHDCHVNALTQKCLLIFIKFLGYENAHELVVQLQRRLTSERGSVENHWNYALKRNATQHS